MRIQAIELAIKEAQARLDSTREELATFTRELDCVKSELSSQRKALGEVKSELSAVDSNRAILSVSLESLSRQRIEVYEALGTAVDRTMDRITLLNSVISSQEERKKELEFLEDELSILSSNLSDAKSSLMETLWAAAKREKEIELINKVLDKRISDIEQREKAVQAESDRVDAWILAVERREKDLKWSKEMHELTAEEFRKEKEAFYEQMESNTTKKK